MILIKHQVNSKLNHSSQKIKTEEKVTLIKLRRSSNQSEDQVMQNVDSDQRLMENSIYQKSKRRKYKVICKRCIGLSVRTTAVTLTCKSTAKSNLSVG